MSTIDLERAVVRPILLVLRLIFESRWLQLPPYVGLMAVASTDRLMIDGGRVAREHV
ncbi:MAG: hypothetical protein ABI580_14500 [Burkholderiaceae bacterium]